MTFSASSKVLRMYNAFFISRSDNAACLGASIPVPRFEENIIIDLCDEVLSTIKRKLTRNGRISALVRIPASQRCVIAGDLHGNIYDLIRIIKITDFSNHGNLLFLGDYVDRGEFMLETIVLLFALQIFYPQQIHLLRGNHEFMRVNGKSTFRETVIEKYGNDNIWFHINKVFEYLPLAALVGSDIFCVHGGISQHLDTINDIDNIKLPLNDYLADKVAEDLLWSDPDQDTAYFAPSKRGLGQIFGEKAVNEFLMTNKVKHIIRAHQMVNGGVAKFAGNGLFTVFSSSNYLGGGNKCGVMNVDTNGKVTAIALAPLANIPPKPVFRFITEKMFEKPSQVVVPKNLSMQSVAVYQ